ncbi:MAG: phosphoribosylanthranilate isomerase [Armatimonadota bacterium]|nr:phosphoribosylanthranilate isomerase [Armatimonadota bacterium]
MTLIKICGITNVQDALAAVELGAHFLGFVFSESPRRAEPSTVKHIRRIIGGDAKIVGVFTEEANWVIETIESCELDFAQLHGNQSEEFAQRIGPERVIRAVRVKSERTIANLELFPNAAFYLLDSYREGLAGGTGETFDWDLAVKAKVHGKPIVLSGGLNPANVYKAVMQVRPFAVDVASGVEESPGKKDRDKMKEFIDNVKRADASS